MHLARNKKRNASVGFTLIELILMIIGVGILIVLIVSYLSKADEKTSENLCRALNAIRAGTKVDTSVGTYTFAPRACKTIDKRQDLPSNNYINNPNSIKEGAKAEIRDLMTRCWWMWLEGRDQNVFDKKWYNLQNGCFICYTFNLGKDVKSFTYDEFAHSLTAAYYAVDTTDRCAPGGQGGMCMDSCNKNSDSFSREVASNVCDKKKCCVSADTQDECKDKGGMCLDSPGTEYNYYYNRWHCKTGSCYIKPYNIASYLDYIEGANGVGSGTGKVLFAEDGGFAPQAKYAISFVSPGKSFDLKVDTGLFGTVAGTAMTAFSIYLTGGLSIPIYVMAGLTGYSAFSTKNAGSITESNYILISKFDTVKEKCAVETGIGEKS